MNYDLNKEAFYDLLEQKLGVKAFEADQEIRAVNATEKDAKLLNIPVQANLLNAQRKVTDIDGKFVDLENANIRSNNIVYVITLYY